MNRFLIATAILLVSLPVSASALSVHVFKADDAPVYMEKRVPAGMEITVYSLDAMKKADAELGRILNTETKKAEYRGMTAKNRYTRAFNKLLNSSEWNKHLKRYKEASEPVEKALRYGVKKLPAYVFDNEYIVYGVPSFREALTIYQRKIKWKK